MAKRAKLVMMDRDGNLLGTIILSPNTPTTIGRHQTCTVVLDDPVVSGSHLRVEHRDGGWWASDLNSRNGTLLNNQRIQTVCLTPEDVLSLGKTRMRFVLDARPTESNEVASVVPEVIDNSAQPRKLPVGLPYRCQNCGYFGEPLRKEVGGNVGCCLEIAMWLLVITIVTISHEGHWLLAIPVCISIWKWWFKCPTCPKCTKQNMIRCGEPDRKQALKAWFHDVCGGLIIFGVLVAFLFWHDARTKADRDAASRRAEKETAERASARHELPDREEAQRQAAALRTAIAEAERQATALRAATAEAERRAAAQAASSLRAANTAAERNPQTSYSTPEERNTAIAEQIVAEYHKSHTYSLRDLFVCGDMACDVLNQLKTKGINAIIMVGRVDRQATDIGDSNHAWVLAETSPGRYLALETTGGHSTRDPLYYVGWKFTSPRTFKKYLELVNQQNEAARNVELAGEEYNRIVDQYNASTQRGRSLLEQEVIAARTRWIQRRMDLIQKRGEVFLLLKDP